MAVDDQSSWRVQCFFKNCILPGQAAEFAGEYLQEKYLPDNNDECDNKNKPDITAPGLIEHGHTAG